MTKDELLAKQPLVYEALFQALQHDRISHAYLFYGPKGSGKKETAYLLAQSLFCQNQKDGFACGTCDMCKRIVSKNHMDFMVLDAPSISKAMVDDLEVQFSKTASEEGRGYRVYMILGIENASLSAMNSLLKFLEEAKDKVVAILTTDNIHQVLDTIVSRCTCLAFQKPTQAMRYQQLLQKGIDGDMAKFLSRLGQEEENSLIQDALAMVHQYFSNTYQELLVAYDLTFKKPDRKTNSDLIEAFIAILDVLAHGILKKDSFDTPWCKDVVDTYEARFAVELLHICTLGTIRLNKVNDVHLVFCQMFEKLEALRHEFG